MSEPDRPRLLGFAARLGIELLPATAEEVVGIASGQDRLWHVADHPEGWRSR